MLQSLALSNYRNHRATIIELCPGLNWFNGPKGAGKTSIKEAVELLFRARNGFTNDKGQGMADQVHAGAKKAVLQGIFSSDGGPLSGMTIERSIPGSDKDTSTKSLPWSDELLKSLLRCSYLLSLNTYDKSSADLQKELFEGLLNREVTQEDIQEGLNTWTPEFPQLGDGWFFATQGKEPSPWDRFLEFREEKSGKNLYDFAYDSRAVANKERDVMKKRIDGIPLTQKLEDVPTSAIAELRKKREAGIAEISAAEGETKGLQEGQKQKASDWKKLQKSHEETNFALKLAQEELNKIGACRLVEEIDAEMMEVSRQKIECVKTQKKFEVEFDLLAAADTDCLPGECARKRMREAQADIRSINSDLQRLNARTDTLHAERARATKREELENRIESLRAATGNLPKLGKEPKAVAVVPPDLAAKKEEMEILNNEILNAEARHYAARKWEDDAKERQKCEEEHALLELDARKWGVAVEAFGTNGIKLRVLGSAIGDLENEIASRAEKFFGLRFKINMNPWSIQGAKLGDLLRPCFQLSGGELTQLSAVIQSIAAKRSGFPLIILDAHHCNDTSKEALWDYLETEGLQSLVFNTSGNKLGAVEGDRARTFWVENGTVTRM